MFFWRKKEKPQPETEDPQVLEPAPAEPIDEVEADPLDDVVAEPIDEIEPRLDDTPQPPSVVPDAAVDRVDDVVVKDGEVDLLDRAPSRDTWRFAALDDEEVEDRRELTAGLEKSRGGFMSRLRGALRLADDGGPSWDDVEETLIAGDVGAQLSMEVVDRARRRRDPGGAEDAVRAELAALLAPRNGYWTPQAPLGGGPAVVLVVGVNGTGKTTTIGKLAARYHAHGRSVILAAADTFRAAAIDQLRIWADRADAPVVAHAPGADPGAVVYDALDAAAARGAEIVIVDTAGRLHTKSNLMEELKKIRRVVDKRFPGNVPETLFVLDATTGQNGLTQAKAFHDAVGLTGIVLTKLDSTAKGGIVFAIESSLGVPVRFVGVGEKVADLVPFDPEAFVAALFA